MVGLDSAAELTEEVAGAFGEVGPQDGAVVGHGEGHPHQLLPPEETETMDILVRALILIIPVGVEPVDEGTAVLHRHLGSILVPGLCNGSSDLIQHKLHILRIGLPLCIGPVFASRDQRTAVGVSGAHDQIAAIQGKSLPGRSLHQSVHKRLIRAGHIHTDPDRLALPYRHDKNRCGDGVMDLAKVAGPLGIAPLPAGPLGGDVHFTCCKSHRVSSFQR